MDGCKTSFLLEWPISRAKLFVSESVYNPHFIGKLLPQLSARNLRKGQNLELTWWHQDDLLLLLVLPLLLTRCFKSMVPCSFDLIAFDQIAPQSTAISQHIPHNIRFWEVLLRIFDEVVPWMSWASMTRATKWSISHSDGDKYSRCLIRSSSYMQELFLSTINSGN